mgnify:CR=1 FL=1
MHAPDDDATGTAGAYAQAATAFRGGQYGAAYGRFMHLADQGHLPSARIALTMHDAGPELFGADWYASTGQIRHWSGLVAQGDRGRGPSRDEDFAE